MSYENQLIKDLNEYNLCSYYLLPLCRVNVDSFGGHNNFVNSWAHPEGKYMYVLVKNLILCEPTAFECLHYLGTQTGRPLMHAYTFPLVWKHEFEKYKEGKYSEFRERAKKIIRETSGLAYRVRGIDPETKKVGIVTDIRIAALYKDVSARLRLIRELDLDPKDSLGPDSELMGKPNEKDFMEL